MTQKEPSRKVLPKRKAATKTSKAYSAVRDDIIELLRSARQTAARAVNTIITATYWDVGRRIVEFEQSGSVRAEYGEQLIERLAADLTAQFGRGFGRANLANMRAFFLAWSADQIFQTPSGELPSTDLAVLSKRFNLPWSAYVRLLSVTDVNAREFYETEALRGGWSVRQLDRQINSQFYERTASSRNKAAMLLPDTKVLAEELSQARRALDTKRFGKT